MSQATVGQGAFPPNLWMASSHDLADAYLRHAESVAGYLRFRLVTRELLGILANGPVRILDVGGGYGWQAVLLAQAGHEVVVVDPDPAMLDKVSALAAEAGPGVKARIKVLQGYGEHARDLVDDQFALVCCHSVLMYVPFPERLVGRLVELTRPGGYISILTVNKSALAMRHGMLRRWADALAALSSRSIKAADEIPIRADYPAEIERLSEAHGATSLGWTGIRIFSDHLSDRPADMAAPDLEALLELEWAARKTDPYRHVARLFHLIAQRVR